MKNILPDSDFSRGFRIISQKDHANGEEYHELGRFYPAGPADSPAVWGAAQWDSGPCLWADRLPSPPQTITDGTAKELTRREDGSLIMRLNTAPFYGGKPHREGMYWPHLLIEQSGSFRQPVTEGLQVGLDLRLTAYSHTPIEGDFVRAAQFLLFLYLHSMDNRDFVWFGLHFFDSRSAFSPAYVGYDGGKPDASGAMIYSVGEAGIFGEESLWRGGAPNPDGVWRSVSVDMLPHIEKVLEIGMAEGYFKSARRPQDFYIDGLNIGWESIGTFDHTMEIRNLSIMM